MVKIVRGNGDPMLSNKSLMKHPSTRLRFSIFVIIANFIMGIVAMILGGDLTALGVFLAMANAPLYAYVLGDTFRASKIPEGYFNQSHGGAGGLGPIVNNNSGGGNSWGHSGVIPPVATVQQAAATINKQTDELTIPIDNAASTSTKPVQTVTKPKDEIG